MADQMKFTPGPWYASGVFRLVGTSDEIGKTQEWCGNVGPSEEGKYRGEVCGIQSALHIQGILPGEARANAHLISAAPDLYAVCEDAPIVSKYHGQHGFELERFISDYEAWGVGARAALTKARGEARPC